MLSLKVKERKLPARMARFAVVGVCILALLGVAGLVLVDYWSASSQFGRLKRQYTTVFDSPDAGVRDHIRLLNRINQWIAEYDDVNKKLWLPWSYFSDIDSLREEQVYIFRQVMQAVLERIDDSIPFDGEFEFDNRIRAFLISGMVRRINIMNMQLNRNHKQYDGTPGIPVWYLQVFDPKVDSDTAQSFGLSFKYYVEEFPSHADLSKERNRTITNLESLISGSRGDYSWLIQFAESQRFDKVKLDDFWSGSRRLVDQPEVSSAYTLKAFQFINSFLDEILLAAPNSSVIVKTIASFRQFYERNYLRAWLAFAEEFDQGKNKLRDRQEWLKAVELMSTTENSYFVLMQRMRREIEPIQTSDILEFRRLIGFFAQLQQEASNDSLQAKNPEIKYSKVSDAYLSYKEALKDLSFSINSTKSSFEEIVHASLNMDNLASGRGAGARSWEAIFDLQRILGKADEKSQLFWNLYTGPVRLAYEYMRNETACFLQHNWEKNVIAELEDETPRNLAAALIGDGGLTWQYMNSFADPFLIRWPKRGYQSLPESGVSWTSEFIDFLNQAGRGRSLISEDFDVVINTLPTGINQSSYIYPYQTKLDLNCADGVQSLTNYNYYTSRKFSWSLQRCSDVTLGIKIAQFEVEKHYTGQKGFPEFLAEFHDGRRVFSPREFPRHEAQLRNENVHAIDVKYEFRGQESIIEMLNAVPLQPPLQVTECWH